MEGDWNSNNTANPEVSNQYNGKEWVDDLGLNMNDYGARWYDPAVARWSSVDPLAEQFEDLSAYNYTYNNPVRFIDNTGKSPLSYESQFMFSDWEELTSAALSRITGLHIDHKRMGKIMQNNWNTWALSSPAFLALQYHPVFDSEQYFSPNFNRMTSFDGKSNGYDMNNNTPSTGNRRMQIENGLAFYEVKKTKKNVLTRGYQNLGRQIDAINHNFNDYVNNNSAFYYLVTTADVTNVSNLSSYAKLKGVNFGHYVSYYKISDGNPKIKFKARTSISWILGDFPIFGGNQEGVSLQF